MPGLFIAGVVVAGYDANKVFIENGRYHGDKIVARLKGMPAPPDTPGVSAGPGHVRVQGCKGASASPRAATARLSQASGT